MTNVEFEALMCNITTLRYWSDLFKCPRCGYEEYRKVMGNVSHTPCTNCGNSYMERV